MCTIYRKQKKYKQKQAVPNKKNFMLYIKYKRNMKNSMHSFGITNV